MAKFGISNVHQHGPVFDTPDFQNYVLMGLLLISGIVIFFLLFQYVFPKHAERGITDQRESSSTQKPPEEETAENKSEINVNNTSEQHEPSIEVALRLLAADERKVVQTLIDAQGSMLQKDISWNTGLSRVKTHRVIERLIQRGIVTSEKYYNTKKVMLADWLINAQNPRT